MHKASGLSRMVPEVRSGYTPIICIPRCPAHPDNMTETLLYLLSMAAGHAGAILLDEQLRPRRKIEQRDRHGLADHAAAGQYAGRCADIQEAQCLGVTLKCRSPLKQSKV